MFYSNITYFSISKPDCVCWLFVYTPLQLDLNSFIRCSLPRGTTNWANGPTTDQKILKYLIRSNFIITSALLSRRCECECVGLTDIQGWFSHHPRTPQHGGFSCYMTDMEVQQQGGVSFGTKKVESRKQRNSREKFCLTELIATEGRGVLFYRVQ